ncbi:hypothetical protein PT974_02684 [Cladobotryum mycophilum]|uniref:Uncharacterized protein n=1 Tax=Cladobotryum mycophilum TaxID=491253 RepID=A0ABR0SYW5_9HYPO
MPSQRQSWWARHCTPRPPIVAATTCPCERCFNMPAEEFVQRYVIPQQQRIAASSPTTSSPSSLRPVDSRTMLLRKDSDNASISSTSTTMSTYHIEQTSKQ